MIAVPAAEDMTVDDSQNQPNKEHQPMLTSPHCCIDHKSNLDSSLKFRISKSYIGREEITSDIYNKRCPTVGERLSECIVCHGGPMVHSWPMYYPVASSDFRLFKERKPFTSISGEQRGILKSTIAE